MFASKDIFLTPPSGGYTIARSVRLRSSASAYLNRTPATTTNQKTWTWSGWVKRGALSSGSYMDLFSALSGANDFTEIRYHYNANDDALVFSNVVGGTGYYIYSSNLFRDPSAWYHIVCSIDTTQATSTNRVKLYVNGVQVTQNAGGSGYPLQNSNTAVNATNTQNIGNINTYGRYFDGYLTEINFIDGQALTPSSFGTTNAITGVWQPAKYTGTYGTNGFYLNFSDNSGATATTIGKDYSGNGNNWTPNNISVTAGATYDSMTDVPTLTSATAANYPVWNPLVPSGQAAPTDGNLSQINTTGCRAATISFPQSGKWYLEWTAGTTSMAIVVGLPFVPTTNTLSQTYSVGYYTNGNKYVNGTASAYGATFASGDIIGLALDFTVSPPTITFYKNNSSQGAINLTSGIEYVVAAGIGNTTAEVVNFGQRPFSYTPPTGFVALNTYNLPAGTITTSGSFTGNVNTDGPFVYLNGVPTVMTINGNAVTFGTNADKLANGFKVRSSSSSYNASGSNTYSITTTGAKFKNANAQTNP